MMLHDLTLDETTLAQWTAEPALARASADRATCEHKSRRYNAGLEVTKVLMQKRVRLVDIPAAKFIPREVNSARRQLQDHGSAAGGSAAPPQPCDGQGDHDQAEA